MTEITGALATTRYNIVIIEKIKNMIVKVKSKKEVLVDTFDNITTFPECEIYTYTKTEEGYVINGRYFYTFEEDGINKTSTIKDFVRILSNLEIDTLFSSLTINYPTSITLSQKDALHIKLGLMYLLGSEQRWGLTINDWE